MGGSRLEFKSILIETGPNPLDINDLQPVTFSTLGHYWSVVSWGWVLFKLVGYRSDLLAGNLIT